MKTHEGRISSLETVYTEIVTPMREDVREIKTNVQKMSLEMPELLRKVNEHHGFVKELKNEGCPRPKNNPIKDNGERGKRKFDQKKYKYMLWTAIVTASGLILFLIGKLGSMLITFGEILEQLPK